MADAAQTFERRCSPAPGSADADAWGRRVQHDAREEPLIANVMAAGFQGVTIGLESGIQFCTFRGSEAPFGDGK